MPIKDGRNPDSKVNLISSKHAVEGEGRSSERKSSLKKR
jgi:hypothetical protein